MTKVAGLLKKFTKEYGGNIAQMGVLQDSPERLLTGMFPFDLATGGGFPEGRVSILFGAESSLKTTLLLKAIAAAQRKYPDRVAAFVDVEGHLDHGWAKRMGVDVDRLVHSIPENAEQAVDITSALLEADDISLVGFDSLAAMATQAELEKPTEDSVMGRQGMAINRFYRRVSQVLGRARMEGEDPAVFKPTLIVINQVRANIGSMHGDPEKQPGGRAFQFVSSLTVRLNGKDIMNNALSKTLPAGKEISIIIRKNKVPILAKSSKLMMALLPNPELHLEVGQVYYWNTLLSYLKNLELLTSVKSGWELLNPATGEVETYKKQDELQDRVLSDSVYANELCAGLINRLLLGGDVIEGE